MILVIGEILIDQYPNYDRIGGAPFNFAYHLKQLGFSVRFFSRVGEDRHGQRILERLRRAGFDLADIQIDTKYPTGTVGVELNEDGVPRFEIHENVAYDHLDLGRCESTLADDTTMVYYGSLLQRTDAARRQVQDLLSRKAPTAIGFCDINMRPPHISTQAVRGSLEHADILKLNEDELAAIQRTFDGPGSLSETASWLMGTFGITTVALTRGGRGSTLYRSGSEISSTGVSGTIVVDTVGAGDAYAAILAAGHIRGRSWKRTLDQASRFAAHICGIPGAVPDDPGFYIDFQ